MACQARSLATSPRRPTGVWSAVWSLVLVLAASLLGACRRPPDPAGQLDGIAPRSAPTSSVPALEWWADVTASSGVDFVRHAGTNFAMPDQIGSGVALFDYDHDGRLDLYLINQGSLPGSRGHRLYHQEGDGHFRDASAGSGLDVDGPGMGAFAADVNNDGRVDVLVTEYGAVRLFENRGDGRFRDVTRAAGLDNPRWATAACFLDFDRDGWLDLVVGNYVDYDPTQVCHDAQGRREFCAPAAFPGTVTRLWRNRTGLPGGAPQFEDWTERAGLDIKPVPIFGALSLAQGCRQPSRCKATLAKGMDYTELFRRLKKSSIKISTILSVALLGVLWADRESVKAGDPIVSNRRSGQGTGTELVELDYAWADRDRAATAVSASDSDHGQAGYAGPASAAAAQSAPGGMALIPAGSFQMGDSFKSGFTDELPVHSVFVSEFYLDKYEVTKALWDEVKAWSNGQGYAFENPGDGKAPNHPVQTVNWFDMVKWCNARSQKEGRIPAYYTDAALTLVYKTGRLAPYVKWTAGYRLPTEAEWEKAARGGASGRRFPWSDADTITHSRANYYSSSSDTYDLSLTRGYHPAYAVGPEPYTSPVGSFDPNGYGLYDLAGTVWEWCGDWFGPYGSEAQSDPHGPASGSVRTLRGGNWKSGASSGSSFRIGYNPAKGNYGGGFRSALPADPATIEAPLLSVRAVGSALVLSWPSTGNSYLIESTGGLAAPNWVALPQPATLASGQFSVTKVVAGVAEFFRLRRQ